MEIPKKREANTLKSAAVAGLVFLSGGKIEAQDIGNWRAVSPAEFARQHIPDSLIQKVSAQQGMIPLDETKAARAYTDARTTFYWINPKPPKTKEEILTNTPTDEQKTISENDLAILKAKMKKNNLPEEKGGSDSEKPNDNPKEFPVNETETPIHTNEAVTIEKEHTEEIIPEIADESSVQKEDPIEKEMDEIMSGLEEYTNRFEVEEAYFTTSGGQKYKLDDIPSEAFRNPDDKTILSSALVMRDGKTGKEYRVLKRNIHGIVEPIFYFAEALKNSGARKACLEFLKRNGKTELTTDEKIKYLEEFFATRIEDLDKYRQPKINESELRG